MSDFMYYEKTKTILKKCSKDERNLGIDYQMNLYKGCTFDCIYCDSRSDIYHIKDFDEITSKENFFQILEKELVSKTTKGIIDFGNLSDPYNEKEKKYKITRKALELIKKYGFGVSIETKSDLILRDIDLLKEIQTKNNVIIKISIATCNDKLAKKIEPHVISSTKRFQVAKKLCQNGIYAGISFSPVLPFLTDHVENIKEMVRTSSMYKVKFIYTDMEFYLRKKVKEYYFEQLNKLYPHLIEKYKFTYKDSYLCSTLNKNELMKIFTNTCKRYGILCSPLEIVSDFKKDIQKENEQISLFES